MIKIIDMDGGGKEYVGPCTHEGEGSLWKSEPETGQAISFDIPKPFRLQFGRGRGWYGLETIVIDETGKVVLHRPKMEKQGKDIREYWEYTTLLLGGQLTKQIAGLIQEFQMAGSGHVPWTAVPDKHFWPHAKALWGGLKERFDP